MLVSLPIVRGIERAIALYMGAAPLQEWRSKDHSGEHVFGMSALWQLSTMAEMQLSAGQEFTRT
jgi:hypothetical protein